VNADMHQCPHCNSAGWTCEPHRRPEHHDIACIGPLMLCVCPIGRALEAQLDRQREEDGARFSDAYVPPTQRLDPVIVGEPLWKLQKSGHSGSAEVRAVHGIGLELRFSIDGTLYHSQMYRDWEQLEQSANEKRGDFEARGWQAGGKV
jgi:hypothetical protein